MKILSIDTSSSICSISILEDKNVIKELSINDNKTHSQNLMPIVKQIFEITNIDLKDIDVIACNKGPGSFTGIRIGVATVKGLAEPYDISVIGINALESLAYGIQQQCLICSLIDARNDNVYFGLFDNRDNKYISIEKNEALHIDDVIEILHKYNDVICFVGDGSKVHLEKLSKYDKYIFASDKQNEASSVNIAQVAFEKIKVNNWEDITPLYLRPSQAERLKDK